MPTPEWTAYNNDNTETEHSRVRSGLRMVAAIGTALLASSCTASCHANGHHAGGGIHGMGAEVGSRQGDGDQAAAQPARQMMPVDVAVGHHTVAFAEAQR